MIACFWLRGPEIGGSYGVSGPLGAGLALDPLAVSLWSSYGRGVGAEAECRAFRWLGGWCLCPQFLWLQAALLWLPGMPGFAAVVWWFVGVIVSSAVSLVHLDRLATFSGWSTALGGACFDLGCAWTLLRGYLTLVLVKGISGLSAPGVWPRQWCLSSPPWDHLVRVWPAACTASWLWRAAGHRCLGGMLLVGSPGSLLFAVCCRRRRFSDPRLVTFVSDHSLSVGAMLGLVSLLCPSSLFALTRSLAATALLLSGVFRRPGRFLLARPALFSLLSPCCSGWLC